ncbi:MAG: hypothetical protein L3J43_10405 [Sulfurovum sp.]|nr:hypothetical protein [Sulfurovum sp.]
MPIPHKVVIECHKCQYTKVVTRGDCLPDTSMFQKCPKCGAMMQDSKKSADEVGGILGTLVDSVKKLLK